MKLLKAELEQIIKEEIDKLLQEYKKLKPSVKPSEEELDPEKVAPADSNFVAQQLLNGFTKAEIEEIGRDKFEKMKKNLSYEAPGGLANLGRKAKHEKFMREKAASKLIDAQKKAQARIAQGAIASQAVDDEMAAQGAKIDSYEAGKEFAATADAVYGGSKAPKLPAAKKPSSKAAKQNALSKRINIPLKKIQADLFKKGYAPKGVSAEQFVDGKYGGMTETAIEDLQDDLGFKGKQVDGLYGGGTHGRWKKSGFIAAKGTASAAAPVASAVKKPVKQTLKSLKGEAAKRIKFYSDAIKSMRALQRELGPEGAKQEMDTLRREAVAAQKKYRDAKKATNTTQVAARSKVRAGGVDSAFEYQQAAQELAVAERDKGENSPEYKAAAQKMIAVIRAQDKDKLGGVASTPSR